MFRTGFRAFLVLGLLFSACSSDSENHELHCDEVWIMLGLDRKDQALADYVDQVSFPDSELYGQYLAMAEIADRFGAASEVIQEVSSSLEIWGMKDIRMGPTGGVINCKGCTETVKASFVTTRKPPRHPFVFLRRFKIWFRRFSLWNRMPERQCKPCPRAAWCRPQWPVTAAERPRAARREWIPAGLRPTSG